MQNALQFAYLLCGICIMAGCATPPDCSRCLLATYRIDYRSEIAFLGVLGIYPVFILQNT